MTVFVVVLAAVGVALWAGAIVLLDMRTRALCGRLNSLCERVDAVGRLAQHADLLARKRLVGGRSGR